MIKDEIEGSFLFFYGSYLMYLFFLIGLIVNAATSFLFFNNGLWILGVWAAMSIFTFPKAILGFIMLIGQNDIIYTNFSPVIWAMFPKTIRKHRDPSLFDTTLKRCLRELTWLLFSIAPVTFFILEA